MKNKSCLLVVVPFLTTASAALAETSVRLPEVVVTSEITEAEEAAQALARIPGGSYVVAEYAWQNHRATTIKDMLDYAPGVFVQPRNGAEASRLSIRGSGLSRKFQGGGVLLLQDGIPINTADGSFDFQEIDPWLVQYAEIYRGANALEYGASSLGGAVNFMSPTAQSAPGTTLRSEAGSFGTLHTQIATSREWEDGDMYIAGTGFSQDGFRGQNTQRTARFSGNVGWQLSPEMETRFYLGHTGTRAEIPGTLTKAETYGDPSQPKGINAARDYARDLDITRIANKTAWQQDATRVESTLYARFRSLENPVFTYISSDAQDYGWRGKVDTPQGDIGEWTSGVNVAYGRGKETRYNNATGETGGKILERKDEALTTEAYLQFSYFLQPDLTLITSGQVSYARRRIEEITPTATEQTRDYTGFNPRIGLLYDLTADMQLFTNLSRSFEPPTLGDLSGGNNPGFKQLGAQTATTIEFGSRGGWNALRWDAAYYHSRVEDEFIQYQFPNGDSDIVNAGDTTHDGIELAVWGDIAQNIGSKGDALALRFAYQWNHFRLRDDATLGDKDLPGIAEHYLRAEAYYTHPSGWGMGPNVEWVPDAPVVDLANTYTAQSYALLGARMDYTPEGKPYGFFLEARNLLDKTYIATYDVVPDAGGSDLSSFYPGDGRAIYAGVRWQL